MENRVKVRLGAAVVVALGIIAALLAWNAAGDDGTGSTGDGTATDAGQGDAGAGGGTSTSSGAQATTSAAPGSAGSSSTTSGASTTTSAAAPALPAADPDAPPAEPLGVYRDGTVTLGGSVPDEELAAAYQRKVGGVIGEENVTMAMTLDPRVSGTSLRIDVDERFQFPAGSAEFDPQFEALLNLGVAALQLVPESTLVVTGHTDDVGDPQVNDALSLERAQIVVDFMTRGGIAPERVVARGAGESQPIADNATAEGRQANRRIEATLEGISPE
jgi:outer membrane protein OmpA-like peptidoglycan-associated protein